MTAPGAGQARAFLRLLASLALAAAVPRASAGNLDLALEETRLQPPDYGIGWLYYDRAGAAGDVDGDGLTDLVVGSELDMVHLYLGTPYGIATTTHQVLTAESPRSGYDLYGSHVAVLDADVDGHADVVVGAYDGTYGLVYTYRGGESGIDVDSERRLDGPLWGTGHDADCREIFFGSMHLNDAGDTDGDGFPELLATAQAWNGESWEHGIFLYPGSSTGLDWCGERRLSSLSTGEYLTRFAGPGDVDGDGYAEVIGACTWCGTGGFGDDVGEVYVWRGGPGGAGAEEPEVLGACCNVSLAPDLDGDGFDDLLVGKHGTYAFYGGATGLGATEPQRISASATGAGGVGDVDGDGLGDLVFDGGEPSLVFGDADRPDDPPALVVWPDHYGSLATYGDFDGDGLSDFAIASTYDYYEGDVYVYSAARTRYRDMDSDGAGDPAAALTSLEAVEGYVHHGDDCDDADAATQGATWYPDADGDGWGVLEGAVLACTQLASSVTTRFDCDDADPAVDPVATDDYADGVDQDCDGWDGPFDPRWACGGDTGAIDDCQGDTGAEDTADSGEPADSGGDTADTDTGVPQANQAPDPEPEAGCAWGCACDGTGGGGSGLAGLAALLASAARRRRSKAGSSRGSPSAPPRA